MKLNQLSLSFLLSVIAINSSGQDFALSSPKGWGNETIPFPIEFAPNIPFVGTEEVRFTPGWGDSKSEEYWSYCYLWYVNDNAVVDEALLTSYLKSYYSGLVGRNITRRKIEQSKVVPTVSKIETSSRSNSNYTYEGTVKMLDYMDQKPITLNVRMHQSRCDEAKKRVLFIEISPQPLTHKIWTEFESIWQGFRCKP